MFFSKKNEKKRQMAISAASVLLVALFSLLYFRGIGNVDSQSGDMVASQQGGGGGQQMPAPEVAEVKSAFNVEIKSGSFGPGVAKVGAATKVIWKNGDDKTYRLRSKVLKELVSEDIGPGATYEFPFMQPGEYDYYCELNNVSGKVVVK